MEVTIAILTVPQRTELLGQAVKSVFDQTFSDFELKIISGGMPDNTEELRARFADPRCEVLPSSGGLTAGRNTAARVANGEYIAFIDDDDTVAPDYIELLLGAAKSSGADIAVAGYKECEMNAAQAMESLLRGELSCELTGKLIRRELLYAVQIPEERTLDGTAAGWRVFAEAGKITGVPGAKYEFNRHPDRVRAADDNPSRLTADYIVEHLAANAEREEYIAANMPELRELARYAGWAYMLEMVEHITVLGLAKCYAPLRYMRNELKSYWREVMYGEYTRDIDRERMQKYV